MREWQSGNFLGVLGVLGSRKVVDQNQGIHPLYNSSFVLKKKNS